jgi:hypothetical protein
VTLKELRADPAVVRFAAQLREDIGDLQAEAVKLAGKPKRTIRRKPK